MLKTYKCNLCGIQIEIVGEAILHGVGECKMLCSSCSEVYVLVMVKKSDLIQYPICGFCEKPIKGSSHILPHFGRVHVDCREES